MKNKLLAALILISIISFVRPCLAQTRQLTIVFTGDTRGELENCHCPKNDFGGFERRLNYINDVKKDTEDILLLDVGDTMPLVNAEFTRQKITYNAFIAFKAMDLIGYDAMNAGESDIILGEDFLEGKAQNLHFSVISSNIVDKNTGQPFFKPYAIKVMKNGLKVGIIGAINERYVINSNNLEAAPNKDMVDRYVREIRDQVDVVIVLAHVGLPYSIELAKEVSGIDVILSGHWDAETQEPAKIGSTIVMPTAYYARKVGRLDLDVEGEGNIPSYEWQSAQLDAKYDGKTFLGRLVSMMPDIKKADMAERPKPASLKEEIVKKEVKPVLKEAVDEPAVGKPLRVLVFYTAGCRSCMIVERDVLPNIEKKYGEKIVVEKYDIGVSRNYAQMVKLEKMYGEEGGYVPEVIVSKYILMGEEEIKSGLEKTIERALSELNPEQGMLTKEDVAAYQAPTEEDSIILSRFDSFSAFTVGAAGFLDGINPCAFTTIVFFISFLAFAGYKKREMIFAGSFFTIAVFMAYFLIGLGICRFLRSLSVFTYLALTINILIGGLAFLLGVLSVVDYFRFRKTHNAKKSILQLPRSIKNRIHALIGGDFRHTKQADRKALVKISWVAFTAGFTVSILESICTGQVYLPTIAYVLKMPDKHISAFTFLLFYNLAFITPLIVIFILSLFGATSNLFSKFMRKHFGFIKLSTAALFFVLAAVLVLFK